MPKQKFRYGAIAFEDSDFALTVEAMHQFLQNNEVTYVDHTTSYLIHSGNIPEVKIAMVYKEPIEESE